MTASLRTADVSPRSLPLRDVSRPTAAMSETSAVRRLRDRGLILISCIRYSGERQVFLVRNFHLRGKLFLLTRSSADVKLKNSKFNQKDKYDHKNG